MPHDHKIIHDVEVQFLHGQRQAGQSILPKISLRPSQGRKGESKRMSAAGMSNSQGPRRPPNISGRVANRSTRLKSREPPVDIDQNICSCDESIKQQCQLSSKPFCRCEGPRETDSAIKESDTKASSLRIEVPQFSHNGTNPVGSKLNKNGERSTRRNDQSQKPNNKILKPTNTDALDHQQKRYFESLISPDLTALPSETVPILGHPTRFRDESFSVDFGELSAVRKDKNDTINKSNNKDNNKSIDISQRESENTEQSTTERASEAFHFPRTLFGFGPTNNFGGYPYSSQPSKTNASQNFSRVPSDVSIPYRNDKSTETETHIPIRRQMTMEKVTYPKFFSHLQPAYNLFRGYRPINNFATTRSRSIVSFAKSDPSIVSLHSARSSKVHGIVKQNPVRRTTTMECLKWKSDFFSTKDTEACATDSPSRGWVPFVFAAAFIWLAYLTYLAIQNTGFSGLSKQFTKSCNDDIYGKFDGQIG